MITIESVERPQWYLIVGWDEGTPLTSARRGAFALRCAACLGDVRRPTIAATPEIIGEAAWHGARCARCHRRVPDPRLVLLAQGVAR
jgi:hypothetical protein